MLAARYGHIASLRHLINAGASVNYSAKNGYTALHNAAVNGSVRGMTLLLQSNAKINEPENDSNETALHKAVINNKPECVKLLIKSGANIEQQNVDGANALHFAAVLGHTECLKALLAADANVQVV